MPEYVYFIEGGGGLKVGSTKNLAQRFRALNTTSIERGRLLGVVPGGKRLERIVQADLQCYRLNGEWFRDCALSRKIVGSYLAEGIRGDEAASLLVLPSTSADNSPSKIDEMAFLDAARCWAKQLVVAERKRSGLGCSESIHAVARSTGLSSPAVWKLFYARRGESVSAGIYLALQAAIQQVED
jgi:hypothetical protein